MSTRCSLVLSLFGLLASFHRSTYIFAIKTGHFRNLFLFFISNSSFCFQNMQQAVHNLQYNNIYNLSNKFQEYYSISYSCQHDDKFSKIYIVPIEIKSKQRHTVWIRQKNAISLSILFKFGKDLKPQASISALLMNLLYNFTILGCGTFQILIHLSYLKSYYLIRKM